MTARAALCRKNSEMDVHHFFSCRYFANSPTDDPNSPKLLLAQVPKFAQIRMTQTGIPDGVIGP
jgi:hypothetical protein